VRALECVRPGELRIAERARPRASPGEVLVRIRRAGVCGTDLHIFEGSHPYLEYPRVIGHELSGEVIESDPGSRFAAGQQIYIVPYLACGTCVACRRARTNCCQNLRVLGVHIDGGMAEYVSVPEANVASADGVSLEEAAMIEFLAIGAHAIRRAAPRNGDRILVVGAGPIGIGCSLFARLRGGEVTVLDRRKDRLDFCRQNLGVAQSVLAEGDIREQLAALTGGDFYDVVIDATGDAKSMMTGLNYVAHGGTYVLVSVVREKIAFEDPEFHKRETTLLASRNALPEDFAEVIAAMRAGKVPTKALMTHRTTLDEAPERFADWLRPEAGVIKAMIEI
jgi:2-desacetyl-2-hydroxyethyl bacteriochlorophyllide A dehydrogenase